jgi:hypothetical protein
MEIANYPLGNARADVFCAIRNLANKSDCEVLKACANGEIYRRNRRGKITSVDFFERDRIVMCIADNLRGKSPYRIDLDTYLSLKQLTELYKLLGIKNQLSQSLW